LGGGGPRGGGGGGGGGGYIQPIKNGTGEDNIEFADIRPIILKRGTSLKTEIEVTNKKKIFLNKCGLVFGGFAGSWLKNSQSEGLSPGEKFVYEVDVYVPEDIEPGTYEANVIIGCDEGEAGKSFEVIAYRNAFEADIKDYEKIGNKLRFKYSLIEYSGINHEISINYALEDLDKIPRYLGEGSVGLGANEKKEEFIEFELPKDSFGEFKFKLELSDESAKIDLEKDVFLPSQNGLTGLAVTDSNKKTLSILGVIVLVLVVLILAIKLAKKYKRNVKKEEVLNSPSFEKKKSYKTAVKLEL
jgi:hypothetical protein